jgi:hypothetical protein
MAMKDCWKVIAENYFVVDMLSLSATSSDINKITSNIVSLRRSQFKSVEKIILDELKEYILICAAWGLWVGKLIEALRDNGPICTKIICFNQHVLDRNRSSITCRQLMVYKLYVTREDWRGYGVDRPF